MLRSLAIFYVWTRTLLLLLRPYWILNSSFLLETKGPGQLSQLLWAHLPAPVAQTYYHKMSQPSSQSVNSNLSWTSLTECNFHTSFHFVLSSPRLTAYIQSPISVFASTFQFNNQCQELGSRISLQPTCFLGGGFSQLDLMLGPFHLRVLPPSLLRGIQTVLPFCSLNQPTSALESKVSTLLTGTILTPYPTPTYGFSRLRASLPSPYFLGYLLYASDTVYTQSSGSANLAHHLYLSALWWLLLNC